MAGVAPVRGGKEDGMGLFSARRPAVDGRPRELRMVGTPLVTADAVVVEVDLVVRFDPRPPSTHPLERGHTAEASWSAVDERIAEAVVVTVLRLRAEDSTGDELLADRTGLA